MTEIREVRASHRLAKHECPGAGCREMVDRSRLACPKHWRRVPKALRDELWDGFREGAGRQRYMAALAACVESLRGKA